MTFKSCPTLTIIASLLLFTCPQVCVVSAEENNKKAGPFQLLEPLLGHHKREHVNGIHDLKKYLEKFGYLHYFSNDTHKDDDDFDQVLENAVRTYQKNYHLNSTGLLDSQTVSSMMKPRCGVPDIINGTTRMRSSKKRLDINYDSKDIHATSHYSFFPGNLKWPNFKRHLTYAFEPHLALEYRSPIIRAFQKWQFATHFTFSETQDYNTADIKISFHVRDHGDGSPFDGPQGILAHAYAPPDGRLHFDADETWVVGANQRGYDVETVALHEIGHLLGLQHSSIEGAIMYPSIPMGATKDLHGDDIEGIKDLYDS